MNIPRLILLVLLWVLPACQSAGVKGVATLPPADADRLWSHITTEPSYRGWPVFPGRGEFRQGTEPHGALITVRVNAAAEKAIKAGKGILPPGSILLKEEFSPDRKLVGLTVMYKVEGASPGGGDWFWAKYLPGGTIDSDGTSAGCLNCHRKVASNDYVFTGPIR